MRRIVVLLIVLISGCSSVTNNMAISTDGSPQFFYRPWAYPAAVSGMLIGFNEKYFGVLRNKQYMKVKVNSGVYDFQVKANSSSSSTLRVTLNPGEEVCLESHINPAVIGVMIVPLVVHMISWFQLSNVTCPDDEFFAEYSEVQKS